MLALALTVGAVLAAPGGASAAPGDRAPTPIDVKYAALGGPTGLLGPLTGSETCWLVDGGCWATYQNGAISWSPATGAHAITRRDMFFAWVYADQEHGVTGYPVTDTVCGLRNGACGQHFQRGSIYDSSAAPDPVVVAGATRTLWAAQGWERGPFGYPTGDRFCYLRQGGCGQHFQGASVYSSAASGTAVVAEPIRSRWAASGWERGRWGYPTSSAVCGLRGGGCGQHFQGRSLYWTPGGAVVSVDPLTRDRWAATGWENGPLGYPVHDWVCGLSNDGCGQHFQGGSIYRMGAQPSRVVLAPIRDRWAATGWENGSLGWPLTDSFCGLRGGGCGQHFAYGSIYWSPATGAAVVSGFFRNAWQAAGWETGVLGYPTTGLFCGLRDGGCGQHFQGGSLYTGTANGAPFPVTGPIRDRWAAQGWENGRLSYPIGGTFPHPGGGVSQPFQRGSLILQNGRVR